MPHVYSLTRLTGRRKNEERRQVIFTFEVRRYALIVSALSAVASVPVTALVMLVSGPGALLVPPVFIVAGLVLWDWRQRRGMRLRNFQAILDTRRSAKGVLYAAGSPIPLPQLTMHQAVTVPSSTAHETAPVLAPATRRRRRGAPTMRDLIT
ncbi:MAG: hypothetical protein CMH36_08800 [Microbacterium sp.]|uniref:hypothetical protein n=1 Tax=uncultured Microbacterium sp. TaxID=191216 RepID=UPI000C8E741D|nr:hypothetical protein [Microbacterium sp.]